MVEKRSFREQTLKNLCRT